MRGPHAFVRHPEYVALIAVMLGLLLLWPTVATLLAFTAVWACGLGLARKQEIQMAKEFGCAWECYAYGRPAWICGALSSLWNRHLPSSGHPRVG